MFSNRKKRRGQSLVEFALVSPIFLLMVFGIIEGGRLVWTYHTLNNATREGLRFAIVRGDNSDLAGAPATTSTVRDHILDVTTGLDSDNLSVTLLTPEGMESQDTITVEADYSYQPIIGLIFGSGTINLESSSEGVVSR